MKYSEATSGRVFVIRLEDGDIVHESLEAFAREHEISAASVIIVGGSDAGSTLVVGPEQGRAPAIVPMTCTFDEVHEVAGTGTIFPDKAGNPVLHLHMACGRENTTITGCVRTGVKVWHVMEAIVTEMRNCTARRMPDAATGFELLNP